MNFINKHAIKIFFSYIVFCILLFTLIYSTPSASPVVFATCKDIDNFLAFAIISILIYLFSIDRDNKNKFFVLKNITAILFLAIFLNFSKIIAMSFIDSMDIILLTLFDSEWLVIMTNKEGRAYKAQLVRD